MGRPHPLELRTRVLAFVDEGHSHRAAARHFRVSPRFVNDMVQQRRARGTLAPLVQGRARGPSKLVPALDWLSARLEAKGEITLDALVVALQKEQGIQASRVTVWRALKFLGLSHKKNC